MDNTRIHTTAASGNVLDEVPRRLCHQSELPNG
eukprot:SAG31_NODE_37937_length_300_cov_0.776119_2_plen_32_part_01